MNSGKAKTPRKGPDKPYLPSVSQPSGLARQTPILTPSNESYEAFVSSKTRPSPQSNPVNAAPPHIKDQKTTRDPTLRVKKLKRTMEKTKSLMREVNPSKKTRSQRKKKEKKLLKKKRTEKGRKRRKQLRSEGRENAFSR